MANDGVIKIGFSTDVQSFIKEIKKELSSVKDWGLSDSLKDEIKDIESMLDGLSKSFSEGLNSKLDTKTFAGFEKKVTEDMATIDKRVTTLEDSMQGLFSVMESNDGGQFTAYLKSIGNNVTELKNIVDNTTSGIKELVNTVSGSGGKIQFVDTTDIDRLDKEIKMIHEMQDLIYNIQSNQDIVGKTDLPSNFKRAIAKVKNTYSELMELQDSLEEASNRDVVDESVVTRLQDRYVKKFADLKYMRDQMEMFGDLDKVPQDVFKALQQGQDLIEGFADRAIERLDAISRARASLGKQSALSLDKEKNSLVVPMDISTTGKGLATKALRIIETAQNIISRSPLKIDFALTSIYPSRKTDKLLKEWEDSIGKIDDSELREKFEGLYQTIAKDFQKEIKLKVTSNIYEEEVKVKKVIQQIKDMVGKKVHIFPQFDIQDVDVKKLQSKLDKIAKQLKLNISNIQLEKGEKTSNKQLEALNALSETLATKLDNLNKNYLAQIKKSLADILTLAQTLKDSTVQTDAPIDELVSSVKDLTIAFQKAFGILDREDVDGIFERIQTSIKGIRGNLEGSAKDNPLIAQLQEIMSLYKEYQRLGGTKSLSEAGGTKKVQKWLAENYSQTDEFKIEGKNASGGYAEGLREGIPEVESAAKEMTEAALEAVRITQDSNSPAIRFKELGKDGAIGYSQGWLESADEIKKAVSESIEEGIGTGKDSSKPFDGIKEGAEKASESVKELAESSDKVANAIADIIANAKKLEKVESPLSKKNWGSLNRTRKNDKREDQQTAQNVLDYTKLYMESGQTEILKVIKDYIESSNLKDTLKGALIRTFTSAIEATEKAIVAETKSKPQTQTQTMSKKQYAEYMRKYAPWKNSDEFNYNLNRSIEELQKRGLASRKTTKSGKLGAWEIQVEVPINQLEKLEEKEKEVETQTKKTTETLSNAGATPSKNLEKHIEKYKTLYEAQQKILSEMSAIATSGGNIGDSKKYVELKRSEDLISRQMNKEYAAGLKGWNVDIRALATQHLEIADAAQKQAKSEEQVVKAEEQISKTNITPTLQKKIDKYKELREELNKLYTELSNMAMQPQVDTEKYKSTKDKARQTELQMQALVAKTYKNHKGANLQSLADEQVAVVSADTAENIQKATEAIRNEGNEAKKAKSKKEGFAKANKKVAKASKETAKETDEASKAIEKEYKHAEKARDKVIQEENDIRKAIEDAPRLEQEKLSNRLQKTFDNLDAPKFGKNFTESFRKQIDDLKDDIVNLFNSGNIKTTDIDAIENRFKSLDKTVSNTKEASKVILAEETSVSGMQAKISGFMDQNTAMSRKFRKELEGLVDTLKNGGELTQEELKAIGVRFNQISAEVRRLHQTGSSFWTSFLKQLKGANAQLIATYFSFQDFIRYAREGFQTVVEVDTALTELRKVSDASDDRLAQSFQKSTETAKELGSTISDVIGVTADWARLNNLGLIKFSQNGETPEEDNPVGNYMICL